MARNRNRKLVPECQKALDQMKYEIASEFGVPLTASYNIAGDDTEFAGELGSIGSASYGQAYGGNLTSREAGSIGGEITKRLVRAGEQAGV